MVNILTIFSVGLITALVCFTETVDEEVTQAVRQGAASGGYQLRSRD